MEDRVTAAPTSRWIRAYKDGRLVVDTRRARVVGEDGKAAGLYAVPLADVAPGALRPSAGEHAGAAHAGATEYFDLHAGDVVVAAAAWRYRGGALPEHVGLAWDAFDQWYEEDVEGFVGPRHAHRVDALPSSRHVRVSLRGRELAVSDRPVIAFEGTQPPRFYLHRDDVDLTSLARSDLRTGCPYKGWASYWDLAGGIADDLPGPVASSYEEPLPEVGAIAGRIAFFAEHVDVEVDGEPLAPTPRRAPMTGADGWRAEPSRRWVRGVRDDATLVDSRRAILTWAPGESVPVYAFPVDDVHPDARWTAKALPALGGHLTFGRFLGSGFDRWYEEDEEVFVHPRDPHVRVDALPSSRHVRIESDGVLLAETRAPVVVFETGLPTRHYLPPEDVDRERLEPTNLRTACPYKGTAGYWSVRDAPELPDDVVWSYPSPLPAQEALRDRLAFFDEHVDVLVDGVLQKRPASRWPRRRRAAVAS
ncbi:hypothetical protein DSM104299_02150 [Baekduia alba]|uniref:DUF427 domain-containing protein n=1 Tax=Baekduia alba TaxID=2997333 RepID=UPI002341EB5C|nr:DUF427 domain-containing protein [Baekduia alba]WCB93437.1 hypothetical protein DSM104299_02150 [Baekduia alba]